MSEYLLWYLMLGAIILAFCVAIYKYIYSLVVEFLNKKRNIYYVVFANPIGDVEPGCVIDDVASCEDIGGGCNDTFDNSAIEQTSNSPAWPTGSSSSADLQPPTNISESSDASESIEMATPRYEDHSSDNEEEERASGSRPQQPRVVVSTGATMRPPPPPSAPSASTGAIRRVPRQPVTLERPLIPLRRSRNPAQTRLIPSYAFTIMDPYSRRRGQPVRSPSMNTLPPYVLHRYPTQEQAHAAARAALLAAQRAAYQSAQHHHFASQSTSRAVLRSLPEAPPDYESVVNPNDRRNPPPYNP